MRLLPSLSASLIGLALSSTAFAGSSPRAMLLTGRTPSIAVAPGAGDAKLATAARAAVRDRAPWANSLELGAARSVTLRSGERMVRMPQMHKGLPVALRSAAVTFDATGAARLVAVRLEEQLPADTTPSIDASQAASITAKRVGFGVTADQATLAIWPSPEGAMLAWVVYAPLHGTPYAPLVVVNANTGKIVLHYNAATTLNDARVYPSNPTKSPTLINVMLNLPVNETHLQNALVKSHNCIDQMTTKSFMGIMIHTCELLQTVVGANDPQDFLSIVPGMDADPEDSFSELSIFYHTNKAYEVFRDFQPGFIVQPAPLDAAANLRVPQGFDTLDLGKLGDPNLPLAPFQNAFFSPANPLFQTLFGIAGNGMFFGQGPLRDYAYDGDVIYHEFTHAVVNATLQLVGSPHADAYGVSVSPGAMNEGLADYFSSAITGDGDVGEYASKDIDMTLDAIRSLTNPDACPTAIGGEVHQDATLFSGGLWDVRATLSAADAKNFDLAVFAAMNNAPSGDLSYDELAELIVTEVNSGVNSATGDALRAAWTTRGVLPQCKRILEYTGTTLNGPADLSNLWLALGTQTTSLDATGYSPGVVQFHAAATSGELTSVKVDFRKVDIQTGGALGGMGTPFAPKVLFRFGDEPIQFTYQPYATTADVMVVDPTASGNDFTATATAPAGMTSVHVMVASAGEMDGAYTAMTMTLEETSGAGGAGGGSGSTSTGGVNPTPTVEGGCGCMVPGQTSGGGAWVALALMGFGLAAARSRKGRS